MQTFKVFTSMNSLLSLWSVYYLLGSHYHLSIHSKDESVTQSVVFDSSTPWTVAKLLCPWDSSGKNIGVCSHSLLQGIFLTEGSNLGLLNCRQIF